MSEEVITAKHWVIIANPKSGKRTYKRQRDFLLKNMQNNNIPHIFKETKYKGHATEIAQKLADNQCINFIVLGGDGTISEVINGIFTAQITPTSKIKIALFPRGTGNDWARYWHIPKKNKQAWEIFENGKTQLIDIGTVNYLTDNKIKKHYFINSIGFGLDALVVKKTERYKKMWGSFTGLYFLALLTSLSKVKYHKAIIKTENNTKQVPLLTCNVANGCYSGGGIKQNPKALPYDGVFHAMMVGKITFKDICNILPNIFNGNIDNNPIVQSSTVTSMTINSDEPIPIEADGILLEQSEQYKIGILPKSILMIVP